MKLAIAPTAYLLISHGSRDPRPQEAMSRLADLARQRLEVALRQTEAVQKDFDSSKAVAEDTAVSHLLPDELAVKETAGRTILLARPKLKTAGETLLAPCDVIVGTACLELSPIELSQQIYEFGQRLIAAGVRELKLLPIFLMAGVHVMEDLPAEINKARQLLGNSIELTLCSHLGGHPQMLAVLSQRLASVSIEASLLVAHGSRRPKGNRGVERLGKQLGTAVAYWATSPDIEEQAIALMQKGAQRIVILPYFLFAGGITDAIAHRTEELAERFPKIKFRLLPTLGATDEVADLAVALLRE